MNIGPSEAVDERHACSPGEDSRSVGQAAPEPGPAFSQALIAWQGQHGRHGLPWQGTRDPYRIWVSEIMLQQTQVSTVIPYYQRFLDRFPDVASLAEATPAEVASLWAGLGYYSRARNLHRAAQTVVSDHAGAFPTTPESLARLPGIGRSTAAAIAAFAWGCRAAILDGNVKRVLCRHFAVEEAPESSTGLARLWALAEALLPATDCGTYSQALMDLGATVCTRSRPACERCPVAEHCAARRAGRQEDLPRPRPRRALAEREASFLLLTDGANILLERRPAGGLWGGLLVPPEGPPDVLLANLGLAGAPWRALPVRRQVFTHFRLLARPALCRVAARPPAAGESGREWIARDEVARAGLPPLFRRLVERAGGFDEALDDE